MSTTSVVRGYRWAGAALGAAAGLTILGGVGRLGLQVEPAAFPASPSRAADEVLALPPNLPAPVERFFQVAFEGRVPVTHSAVITGRGCLTISSITFPTRFRFVEAAGRAYRHYIECTWFGHPVLKVNEWYLDGRLRQELPFGVVANEPKADAAANLALWGETIWLPSVLLADPRLHWDALDQASARLVVPGGQDEDSLTVAFSRETGLIESLTALRYKSARARSPTRWRIDILDWTAFHGVRAPSRASITWLDQGRPWFVMTLEDVAYNVDVSRYIAASGP